MGEPFVGEIRMFGGTFAPAGWAMCQGQLMPISENETLFNLIGTMYGGDGQETFALPDLQGRAPMHAGQGPGLSSNYIQAEQGGVESVTLSIQQIPIHNHSFVCSTDLAASPDPTGALVAQPQTLNLFFGDVTNQNMNNNALQPVGGSQPHENLQPYLVLTFIISLFGVFPQQN
jgi:microcystin-dependent protein